MIYPQLAKQAEVTSLEAFIKDDSWVAEQKLDGDRILYMSPGADMAGTPITRNGSIYSKKIPQAMKDFRFPEGVEMALDGELVNGTFWVFDMPLNPLVDGHLDHDAPLWARRAALEAFFASVPNPFRLVPQAKTVDEKIRLAETALKSNYEGLLLKKTDAPYRSGGRTPEWLKVKFVSTADVIVTGVRTDGKDSVDFGLYEQTATTGVPGVLTTGPIPCGRASLIGKEKNGVISVGDVIEVRYLYTGAGGRLFQPTIMRKRDDKGAHECTTDQLKHVNKEVLESL
jgi:ATP-dependent DNA ligase